MKSPNRYRWFVVAVFFCFMLLHQSDRLLIGPLTTPIMETFHINEAQMGAVFTGALIVAALLYPLWGYLYDRFARARLLAVASFIWGSTTWLSALAPTYPTFLAARAARGMLQAGKKPTVMDMSISAREVAARGPGPANRSEQYPIAGAHPPKSTHAPSGCAWHASTTTLSNL